MHVDTLIAHTPPNARGVRVPVVVRQQDVDRFDVYVGWRVNSKPYRTFAGARRRALAEATRP